MQTQDPKEIYRMLGMIFKMSQEVCDPVDFAYRQKALLEILAKYILIKDKPEEDAEEQKQVEDK